MIGIVGHFVASGNGNPDLPITTWEERDSLPPPAAGLTKTALMALAGIIHEIDSGRYKW